MCFTVIRLHFTYGKCLAPEHHPVCSLKINGIDMLFSVQKPGNESPPKRLKTLALPDIPSARDEFLFLNESN